MKWELQAGIELCYLIEEICPQFGFHVALTGGLLYKEGLRKDADILFYSIRQQQGDRERLIKALESIGCRMTTTHGWLQKALYKGKAIDFMFPETSKSAGDGKSGTQ